MKTLLLLCLLDLSLHATAQVSPKLSLPVDSLTGKVTYQGVVQVPGATQAELYSRAREWFATTFGSAKAVLEMDDRIAGKLIGNTWQPYLVGSFLIPGGFRYWHSVKVEVKEGRYRYSITDWQLEVEQSSATTATPQAGRINLERLLPTTNTGWHNKKGGTDKKSNDSDTNNRNNC